jgi:hypothetical protein
MRRLVFALCCTAVFGCSDKDPAAPRTIQLTGNYTLLTINSAGLPYPLIVFPGGSYVLEQVSGSFSINADSSYREDALLREHLNDPQQGPIFTDIPVSMLGRWEAEDSVLIVTNNANGAVGFGFVSENRLTLSFSVQDSLFTYVYQRN